MLRLVKPIMPPRSAVLALAVLVVLASAYAESPWGTISSSESITVPAGSFSDAYVGAVFSTLDTTGGVFRVVPQSAASTACAMPDGYEYADVAFAFTRVDTLSPVLAYTIGIALNTTEDRTYYRHGLHAAACVNGKWVPLNTVGCTTPQNEIIDRTGLWTSTCRSNVSVSLLRTACSDARSASNPNKHISFLPSCHQCVEGWRGCGCNIRSEDVWESRSGVVLSMSILAGLTYFAMVYARYYTMGFPYKSATKAYFVMGYVVLCLFLLAWLLARMFGAHDDLETTDVSAQGYDVLRGVFVIVFCLLSTGQVLRERFTNMCMSQMPASSDNRGLVMCAQLFLHLLMVFSHLVVLLAASVPVFLAHRNLDSGSVPDVWMAYTIISFIFVVFQEMLTYAWTNDSLFGAKAANGWNQFCGYLFLAMGLAVATMLAVTSSRIGCE